jgi:hypothetical protein
MPLWGRVKDRLADRSVRRIAPALNAISDQRWAAFSESLAQGRTFFEAKWHLEGWNSGSGPPRPRAIEELAAGFGATPEAIVAMDWDIIDFLRERRKVDYWQRDFVCVPVAGAQEWWDSAYGWYCYWDSAMKPKSQWAEHVPREPILDDSHLIEDEDELRQHLIQDHGCTWAEKIRSIESGHTQQHKYEAEDRYWDSRFRST